jgi:hypothetical protein
MLSGRRLGMMGSVCDGRRPASTSGEVAEAEALAI